jgi:hypothetical protein
MSRRRPTARLLTPAGWLGTLLILAIAAALAAMTVLAR